MKKFLTFLFLLASLTARTALAAVYSVNIGATNPITEGGITWNAYSGPVGYVTVYPAFSFHISGMDATPILNMGSGFTGYASAPAGSMLNFWTTNPWDTNPSDTVYVTAFSQSETPHLSPTDPSSGTIDALYATGVATLGGESYYFATYRAHFGTGYSSGHFFAIYDSPLNAFQLSTTPVPEPASLVLLGMGVALAALIRRKRFSAEE